MSKLTEAQKKEFWEWIKPVPKDWRQYEAWLYGGYPPINLNNLDRYAIPKVIAEGYDIEISVSKTGTFVTITKEKMYHSASIIDKMFKGEDEDLTTALLQALWQVKEGETNDKYRS